MTYEKLLAAIQGAERFITAANRAGNDAEDTKYGRQLPANGSKYTAAAKRASLDLTRALAEMRKP